MNNTRVIAIMPIKLNNERLPNKNIMLLGDKPLLRWQLDIISKLNLIDETYVFCSSDLIIDYLPANVQFLKRSAELDEPTKNFNDIFSSFINLVNADIYIYVHATAPFVSLETIRDCLEQVIYNGYDSAFCATKLQDFLWQKGKPLNFDASNMPRSQDLEVIWRETSGVYVIKKQMYEHLHRRIGNNPYIREVSYKESVDINNPEDFELAKVLLYYGLR